MGTAPFAHAGEVYSLLAALVWSGAVILYKRITDTVHPFVLNVFKTALALVLFVPTVLLLGGFHLQTATGRDLLALAASGVLGIAVSDTLLLKSLQLLGAGLYSIVVCLYGVFIVTLSFVFLDERLTLVQLAGVAAVSVAVAIGMYEPDRAPHRRAEIVAGLWWGVAAMLSNAVGVVLMKGALSRVGALDAITLRIAAGLVALLPFVAGKVGRRALATLRPTPSQWRDLVIGSALGMFAATVLWVLGMKYTLASIASTLNQLSNVFVFVLAVVFLAEPLTSRKVAGIVVGTAGAVLVVLGA